MHRLARAERRREVAQPDHVVALAEPRRERRREQDDRRREDRRNHAGHVELERQVRALALVDLVADLSLRVVDQDLAQRALDEHHERRDDDHERGDAEHQRDRIGAGVELLQRLADRARQPGGDAGEDQQRDAVAEAALR